MMVLAMQRGIWGAGVLLYGLLSGCAVLTIDVDVYKGSLVNEEHVQAHQLVALATAAQPMLVYLRDNLEWPRSDGLPPPGVTCPDKGCWYKPGYVAEPEGFVSKNIDWLEKFARGFGFWKPADHFQDPYARRVNEILSLYDDLISPDLALYGKNLRESLERWQLAKLDFETNQERDQAKYASIATGFKSDKELSPDLEFLMNAYKELLISPPGEREGEPTRKVGKFMDALKVIADKNSKEQGKERDEPQKGLEADLIKEWKGTEIYKEQTTLYERRLPFRAVWKFLGEGWKGTLLSKVTRQLFVEGKQGDSAYQELERHTKMLADAYWNSGQAIREIWEESLNLLMRIERLDWKEPSRYRMLKDDVIELVVELTSVRQIASALDRLRSDGKCSVLGDALESGLICEGPNSDVKMMEWSEVNVMGNSVRFELILRRALSAAPTDMAHFLLSLDSLEKKADPQDRSTASGLVKKANKDNSHRLVRLGLNRRYVDYDKKSDSQRMIQSINEVHRNLAQGFGRGRSLEGIYKLTENYLKFHESAADDAGGKDKKDEEKLFDALVEFAQKILFLANHEGLVSTPTTPGLLLGGGENLTRGLFGDWVTDRITIYPFFRSGLPEAKKQAYVRVLQAVGNSILFSANELRERERHHKAGLGKVNAEINAVNLTHATNPKKVLDDLQGELKAEQDIVDQQVSVSKLRKMILGKELSVLVGTQLPDLSAKQAIADAAVTTAQAKLTNYQSVARTLKALHQVLLTEGLDKKILKAWGTPFPSVSTIDCFLKIATTAEDLCVAQWTGLASGGSADSIEKSIQNESAINWPTLTVEQQENYKDAIDYVKDSQTLLSFMNYRQREGHTSLTADDLLKVLNDHVHTLEQKRMSDEKGLIAQVAQAKKPQTEYQKEIASANSRTEAIKNELSTLESLIAAHPFDSQQIQNARQEISSLTDFVRKQADAKGELLSAKEIYGQLNELLKQGEVKGSSSDKQKFKDAQAVLVSRVPPSSLPPLDPNSDKYNKYKSPQAVMDEVIALLRHRQIEAAERFGKGSVQDKNATAALENAYQHRAGMLYIRPSSAYLRTSFPSTSLQDDPNLAWDNMLLQQGIRNLPFSSQLRDILDPSVRQDRLLTSELDKQFWQNINRVRISGVGRTNQVVAKDDVGNWYVKDYYANPKDIIKSAKNLALFNLGMKLPVDLAGELKAASKPKGDSKTDTEAESPPLNRILAKHRDEYQTKTTEASTKLQEMHTKDGKKTVHGQIVRAWGEISEIRGDTDSMDALKDALEFEIQEWDKAAEALKSKSDQDQGQLIVKDLRALSRLEKSLSVKIQEIDKKGSKPREKLESLEKALAPKKDIDDETKRLWELKAKATAEMRRLVGPLVLDILKDRKQTLDSYEQAIMFIGDATNPKGSSQKQSN